MINCDQRWSHFDTEFPEDIWFITKQNTDSYLQIATISKSQVGSAPKPIQELIENSKKSFSFADAITPTSRYNRIITSLLKKYTHQLISLDSKLVTDINAVIQEIPSLTVAVNDLQQCIIDKDNKKSCVVDYLGVVLPSPTTYNSVFYGLTILEKTE